MGEGTEDVQPTDAEPTTEETVREEQHLPTTEERLEHCYEELRTLRAEIAELRSHSHAELAHSTHEHPEHAKHDHVHTVTEAEHTSEPHSEQQQQSEGGNDSGPSATHPYFRRIGR